MTPQEAKALFEEDLKDGKCNDNCPECNARGLAISALEKQIPKKPILDTIFPSGVKWYLCATCNHNNIELCDCYCHNCGQALDWSDTE